MHRLDAKQQASVLAALHILNSAWKDGSFRVDFYSYDMDCPEELAPHIAMSDFASLLASSAKILENNAPLYSLPKDERARDLQIIYDVLGLTPPTD